MRSIQPLNQGWTMQKGDAPAVPVSLPHCYNAVDGQDGSPMYRGAATYARTWTLTEADAGRAHYLEVGAASLCSRVRVNGVACYEGKCGFSLYRVALDPYLHAGENRIEIEVSNAPDPCLYPSMADFSFYGGLYRGVNLIVDDPVHFAETDGSRDGIRLEPSVEAGGSGILRLTASAFAENGDLDGAVCKVRLEDACGNVAASAQAAAAPECSFALRIPDVQLWEGLASPYLYTAVVTLCGPQGQLWDERRLPVGFRTVSYDPQRGLLLNGKPCQLRGVARHQDFGGLGNAITRAQMEADLRLILEMGANAVRCSHYQHCDEWYELCDRAGLLVWAEVPVISAVPQKAAADQNAMQQLDALIAQARNHCSIFCWGVQNEVCMISKNAYTFDLVDRLSRRARALDPSRMTAQANEYSTENDCPILQHTDILGFNLYYGWYYGQIEELQGRLDAIHAANPQKPIILTEYGVDTNPAYHSLTPKANDYSEEYQLRFSANALRAIEERGWMAGGFVWNMFDFGSAGRDEGGKKGQNQKGLMTIDRQLKKDAYYLYKAFWSKEPFVYLAGRRFVNRPQEKTGITVLTNMARVCLAVNGVPVAESAAGGPMRVFEDVPLLPGENRVCVTAQDGGSLSRTDEILLCRVEQPDPGYTPPVKAESTNAVNWFEGLDVSELTGEAAPLRPEGFSFDDTIQDIFDCPAAKEAFLKYLRPLTETPRFAGCMGVTVHQLMNFVRRMNIPEALQRQCEQALNRVDK